MYCEITKDTKHEYPIRLVPTDEVNSLGFTSTYEFPEETYRWILNNYHPKFEMKGSTIGLSASKMPVSSGVLYVDFDGEQAEQDAKKLCNDLRDMNITYKVYLSGGKGYHVHILCVRYTDWRVPYSQKEYIKSWAESRGAIVDYSIYRSNGLFRLPNTIHSKTGKAKQLLDTYIGNELQYPLLDSVPEPTVTPSNKNEALTSFWRQVLTQDEAGGRGFKIYKITNQGRSLGMSLESITEIVNYWNSRQDEPVDAEYLEEKIYKNY